MTANVSDVLVVVFSLMLQNRHPSIIIRSFEITRISLQITSLVTYWGVDFTLLFEYPYFFGGFSADKIRRRIRLSAAAWGLIVVYDTTPDFTLTQQKT